MPSENDLAIVKVFKFDPNIDKKPQYSEFRIPIEGMSVLDVLKTVYDDFDAELAFRWGCEGAGDCRCGACAVTVNGMPVLACRKKAEPDMLIEPHPKFEIIRDLVVDFNSVRQEIPETHTSVKIIIDPEKCIKCSDCVNICPVGVYKAEKGEIFPATPQFCLGETCRQCVTYCQANAIAIESI